MAIVNVTDNRYTVDSLYQWDLNQELEIRGLSLPSAPSIHFTNQGMDRAIVRAATMDTAGVIKVNIPNSLLQSAYKITAYVCIYEGETFETLYAIVIPVKARTKPSDYTITGEDEEIYSFNALENLVNNTLYYVDNEIEKVKKDYLPLSGGKMTGSLDMDGKAFTGLPNAENDTDALPMKQAKELFPPTGMVSEVMTVTVSGELMEWLMGTFGVMKNETRKTVLVNMSLADGLHGGFWFIDINKVNDNYGFMQAKQYNYDGGMHVSEGSIWESEFTGWIPRDNRYALSGSNNDRFNAANESEFDTKLLAVFEKMPTGSVRFVHVYSGSVDFLHGGAIVARLTKNMQLDSGKFYGTVEMFKYGSGGVEKYMKHVTESVISPLEYENPPMVLGIEYRTTERWNGKPVYTKWIDCGRMPNTTTKATQYNPNAEDWGAIRCVGIRNDGQTIPYDYSDTDKASCYASSINVFIRAHSDATAYFATAQVWYVKY